MLAVTIDFRQYDRRVEKTEMLIAEGMRKGVESAAEKSAAFARKNFKHKKRTGRLTSKAELFSRLDYASHQGARAYVTNTTPYARYVEYPTRPHIIRPKNGSFLRFKIGNRVIYARKVKHPGTRGFPFMRPALRPGAEHFYKHFQDRTMTRISRVWRTK